MSRTCLALCLVAATTLAACGEDSGGPAVNEQEVITTVTLRFSPQGGGADVVASFDDPDGDGGAAPSVDAITLDKGTTYALSVELFNKLAQPVEAVTDAVKAEADEHQLFFSGSAVKGPASDVAQAPVEHAYTDKDAAGRPLGLTNTITASNTGSGDFTVTLRHLPPVNDTPVKTATLANDVAKTGIGALPGESDVSVTFKLTVQ